MAKNSAEETILFAKILVNIWVETNDAVVS